MRPRRPHSASSGKYLASCGESLGSGSLRQVDVMVNCRRRSHILTPPVTDIPGHHHGPASPASSSPGQRQAAAVITFLLSLHRRGGSTTTGQSLATITGGGHHRRPSPPAIWTILGRRLHSRTPEISGLADLHCYAHRLLSRPYPRRVNSSRRL